MMKLSVCLSAEQGDMDPVAESLLNLTSRGGFLCIYKAIFGGNFNER